MAVAIKEEPVQEVDLATAMDQMTPEQMETMLDAADKDIPQDADLGEMPEEDEEAEESLKKMSLRTTKSQRRMRTSRPKMMTKRTPMRMTIWSTKRSTTPRARTDLMSITTTITNM